MAARAIWKGVVCCEDFRLPVKLYSAVEDQRIHFHLLHDRDQVRLKQKLLNSITGEAVEYQQARRGAEVERGVFVMLSPDELSSLQPQESRDIDVLCFVDHHGLRRGGAKVDADEAAHGRLRRQCACAAALRFCFTIWK